MPTIGRKAACIVMLLFLAEGMIASATRFVSSARAGAASTAIAPQAQLAIQQPQAAPDFKGPNSAGHFSGRVTGPDGKPLSGARVFIVPIHGTSKQAGTVRARTGADGRFAFDAPDMTYTPRNGVPARREGLLTVTKVGYAPDWFHTWGEDHVGLRTCLSPVKGAPMNLRLARDDVPIHGRFLDPKGRPLAGALVRVHALVIPLGHDLGAHLDREKNVSLWVMEAYERELFRPQIPGLATETRTGANGRFTLTGIGRDRLAVLAVSAPSVVDTHLTVMTRDEPDVGTRHFNGKAAQVIHGAGFTLQVQPGRTVKGRVIDRDSRKPIAGMWVGPLQNPANEFSSRLYPWVTDEQGRFTITGLNPAALAPDKIERAGRFEPNFNRLIVAASTPGLPYETAWAMANDNAELVIECRRGIPFRLEVVDEQGRPVEAEVTYVDVQPGADVVRDEVIWPVGRAARKADGSYEGFVLPGPGAVLVRTPRGSGYRRAQVNAKAFFAPGRMKWTAEEQETAYGTPDTLTTSGGRYLDTFWRGWTIDQRDYAAIVLVNPSPASGPLKLSATVVRERPRNPE
jgi:protocatechuate 3,4-dioxygenase beta subunit